MVPTRMRHPSRPGAVPWMAFAVVGAGVMLALVPVPPNDLWWHMRAGELIVAEGRIPSTNMFAWTLPADAPFVYAAWLGEVLFYGLYQLGGLALIVFVHTVLGTLAFGLVGYEAWRRTGSGIMAATAIALAAGMSVNNLVVRTQNFAWLPFMLYVVLLGRFSASRLPAWVLPAVLPALMIFWVNVHGSFITGLVLVGLWALGETLRAGLRHEGAPPIGPLRVLWLTALLCGAAMLLNPQGLGIIAYVALLTTNGPSRNVVDWLPPRPEGIAGVLFFLTVIALVAAWGLARRRPILTDVLVCCAFLWLAFGGTRYVVWFGMLVAPVLFASMAPVEGAPTRGVQTDQGGVPLVSASAARRGGARVQLALTGLLIIPLVLVQPWLKPLIPWPAIYRSAFVDLPGAPLLADVATPVAAAEYLRANPTQGRLFNELGYGSYLIWAARSEQVFIDTRVELFPDDVWNDYVAISRGRDVDSLLIERYDVTRALVDRELQPALAAALASSARWELEWAGGQSLIFRRAGMRAP